MIPIRPSDRIVRNLHRDAFVRFEAGGIVEHGASYLQLDAARPAGTGLYAYPMEPGARTVPHQHTSDELFVVLEGELVDHDGTRYGPGDMVLLRAGTQHGSTTPDGCTLLVYVDTLERPVR
jgi:mannose-6-phosphate isomerase-like protein (cupin superfamily)